jgi:histone H3/H4
MAKPKAKRGVAVLEAISKLWKSVHLLISRRAFKRIITNIVREGHKQRNKRGQNVIKFKPMAVMALQEATEAYITRLFEDTELLAVHARRMTIEDKDMTLACRLRGDENAFWWTRSKNN